MSESLAGRHAVVTGATRGIGAVIAQALVVAGARVTLMGRDAATLSGVAADLGLQAHAVTVDVADAASIQQAFAAARERFGPVSILVNNAGQAATAPVSKLTLDEWQRLLAVNLTGTFLCAQQVLPDMLAAHSGRIVNIASTAALRGYAYVSAYAAAKHGVLGFTRSLALEVATQGITVNAVCPGFTDTAIVRDGIAQVMAKTGRKESEVRAIFTGSNPQRRLIQPEEVASSVLWLVSEGAKGVNGAAISISGGETT